MKDASDRRSAILEAAIREFSDHGYAGARVDRIARNAAVNKQLLFYYFKSKVGLYRAVAAHVAAEARQAAMPPVADQHPEDTLMRAITHLFGLLSARPHLVRLATGREPQADLGGADEVLGPLASPLRGMIAEGQGKGYFRDDVDPDVVAQQIVLLTLGYLATRPGPGNTADSQAVGAVTSLFVRALSW